MNNNSHISELSTKKIAISYPTFCPKCLRDVNGEFINSECPFCRHRIDKNSFVFTATGRYIKDIIVYAFMTLLFSIIIFYLVRAMLPSKIDLLGKIFISIPLVIVLFIFISVVIKSVIPLLKNKKFLFAVTDEGFFDFAGLFGKRFTPWENINFLNAGYRSDERFGKHKLFVSRFSEMDLISFDVPELNEDQYFHLMKITQPRLSQARKNDKIFKPEFCFKCKKKLLHDSFAISCRKCKTHYDSECYSYNFYSNAINQGAAAPLLSIISLIPSPLTLLLTLRQSKRSEKKYSNFNFGVTSSGLFYWEGEKKKFKAWRKINLITYQDGFIYIIYGKKNSSKIINSLPIQEYYLSDFLEDVNRRIEAARD